MNRSSTTFTVAWLLVCLSVLPGWAQSNAPIRLALLGANAEPQMVLDLLTVELSQSENLALLERTEIERALLRTSAEIAPYFQ